VGGKSWAPPVDLCETERELILSFDVPGLKDGEIAVTLNGRRLTVSGGRARPIPEEACRLHRFERAFGPFRREITLPCGAVELGSEISSSYEDGVLELRIARSFEREPQRIKPTAEPGPRVAAAVGERPPSSR
jgi:HSP20 family protein